MFNGFSPRTIDFMWRLRLNNEMSWFDAHKPDFQRNFQLPMKELGLAVFERVTDKCPDNGFMHKLSRIYVWRCAVLRTVTNHAPANIRQVRHISYRREGNDSEMFATLTATSLKEAGFGHLRPCCRSYGFGGSLLRRKNSELLIWD